MKTIVRAISIGAEYSYTLGSAELCYMLRSFFLTLYSTARAVGLLRAKSFFLPGP